MYQPSSSEQPVIKNLPLIGQAFFLDMARTNVFIRQMPHQSSPTKIND